MTVHGQHYWAGASPPMPAQLEQRRQSGLNQAQAADDAHKNAWPEIHYIHLSGFILDELFRDHCDLDKLVDGLPSSDLLDAIGFS